MESYEVMWERDTSVGCPAEDEDSRMLNGSTTSYHITKLEENSSYRITLVEFTGTNEVRNSTTAMTMEAGGTEAICVFNVSTII